MGSVFGQLTFNPLPVLEALFTFFYIDFLDTSATLFAVADMAGFVKEGEADFPGPPRVSLCTKGRICGNGLPPR